MNPRIRETANYVSDIPDENEVRKQYLRIERNAKEFSEKQSRRSHFFILNRRRNRRFHNSIDRQTVLEVR